jgi:hypothetical protein
MIDPLIWSGWLLVQFPYTVLQAVKANTTNLDLKAVHHEVEVREGGDSLTWEYKINMQ